MNLFNVSVFALLASYVSADCQLSSDGNYYCGKTDKVIYENVGFSGSYNQVTSMNEDTGACSSQPFSFNGNLAPLNEELSVHFRGPLKLAKFAVYYPASTQNYKRDDPDCQPRHAHHKHKRATNVVEVTKTIFVGGQQTTLTTVTPALSAQSTQSGSSNPSSGSASQSSGAPQASNGDWVRTAYYAPGTADGLVFLNNHGGSGSGVWSKTFGNSLSYCNSDASGGASSPQVLDEVLVPSNNEYLIMSNNKCDGDSCGFYREGIPAYHGFGGDQKIFVFEFTMPSDGSKGFNMDMPAIWLLNAQIPRTLQYGSASCSCWSTGCGEMDLFEILSSGSEKLISHLHDGQGSLNGGYGGGGSQDWFQRPLSDTMTAAVVMTGKEVHILEVSDSFDKVLSSATVQKWIDQKGSVAQLV